MSLTLAAGPTSLDRLATAIGRLEQKHGFQRVAPEAAEFPAGLCALLLTEDPQRNLEVLDACVILPEALKAVGDGIARRVAGPDAAPALMQRYGVARAPAVVFLRDGEYVGALAGIRDWAEYRVEVERLLAAPTQGRKAIPIPVRAVNQGACA